MRYYFHLVESDQRTLDVAGTEFAIESDAHLHCLTILAGLIIDAPRRLSKCSVLIVDDQGAEIGRIDWTTLTDLTT